MILRFIIRKAAKKVLLFIAGPLRGGGEELYFFAASLSPFKNNKLNIK